MGSSQRSSPGRGTGSNTVGRDGGVDVVGVQVEPVGGVKRSFEPDDDVGANGRHRDLKHGVVGPGAAGVVGGTSSGQGPQG